MNARSLLVAVLAVAPGGGAHAGPAPELRSAEALASFTRSFLAGAREGAR